MRVRSKSCAVPECERKHFCKGYCRLHFERWKRHGDPAVCLKPLSPRGKPLQWIEKHKSHIGEDCLIWPFARFPDGRAHMAKAKPTRIMCAMAHGPAPSRVHEAAHSCGNGHNACIHPQHLRWATPKENSGDKVQHGTLLRGERHYNSRLTEENVLAIRRLSGVSLAVIAKQFGIATSTASSIRNGHKWAWLRDR